MFIFYRTDNSMLISLQDSLAYGVIYMLFHYLCIFFKIFDLFFPSLFVRRHTKFGLKVFEIYFVIEI